MSDRLAILRTDASTVVGGGHLMRCRTLARALREAGWTCRFVVGKQSRPFVPGGALDGIVVDVLAPGDEASAEVTAAQ